MNIIVNSDRTVEKEYTEKDGSQNENRVTELNFTLPEAYSGEGFVTKIAFITEDGNFSDYIEDGLYVLKNNITKYREVVCFVWLTNSVNNIDFRSQTFKLDFYYNEDPSNYIPSEQEKSQIELLMEELEEKIQEVTELEENVYTKDETYSKEEVDEIIPTDISDLNNDSGFIDKDVNNLTNYYKKSETYTKQEIDGKISSVYKYKGTVASYNNLPSTGLTIGDVYNVEDTGDNYAWTGTDWDKLGGEIDLSGYQEKIDNSHKLSADLVDDTSTTHKFTSTSEKNSWNAKYNKPSGGIPKTDLASDVQTSLGKADSALQEHQDISGKEDKTNKTSIIDENSTNTQYTGAKAVYDELVLRDEKISDLKTKNELLVKDHVPIENTGTELQLTGTGDLPMELVPYGNISQETREGYNLFKLNNNTYTSNDLTIKVENGVIKITGTASANVAFGIPLAQNINLNGAYTLNTRKSGTITGYTTAASDFQINLLNSSRTQLIANLSIINSENVTKTQTVNDTGAFILVYCLSGITCNVTIYTQLLSGTYTTSTIPPYEAYGAAPSTEFESPVKVVDGSYVDKVENKNWFDNTDYEKGYSYTGTTKSVNANWGIYYLPCVANDSYVIGGLKTYSGISIVQLDNNKNAITELQRRDDTHTSYTITATQNGFIAVTFLWNNVGQGSELNTMMITKGTTIPDSYIPHAEQTVSIDTSPNPLYSENDCYKYLTTEQATALGLNTGAGWYVYNEYANQDFASGVSSVTINDMKSNGTFYSTVGGTVSGTTITFDGTTTGNGNIVYELATPTYTKITNTTLIASLEALKDMQSYYDITNISQTHGDNQADMRINAKALKSLKAMQNETDTLLNAKVDKSSFVYDSNTETLSITIS